MTRHYPRGYLIVTDGKVEKITVKDPVHEAAIVIKHPEATGTSQPEAYDDSWEVIEDD